MEPGRIGTNAGGELDLPAHFYRSTSERFADGGSPRRKIFCRWIRAAVKTYPSGGQDVLGSAFSSEAGTIVTAKDLPFEGVHDSMRLRLPAEIGLDPGLLSGGLRHPFVDFLETTSAVC